MGKPSRNHHYIPQFYLRGFTVPNGKKNQLHVIDKIEGKHYLHNPRKVGVKRDFNSVSIPGHTTDEAEKLLSQIDAESAMVLKHVKDTSTLPKGSDMPKLFYFLAMLHGHNLHVRNSFSNSESEIIKQILRLLVSSRERYESKMKQVYGEDAEVVDYEKMKQFIDEDRFDIKYGHGHHLAYELQAIDAVWPLLARRQWSLLIATEGTSDFVCSDRPVALVRTDIESLDNPNHPYTLPGLDMPNTELTAPLNRRMALVATFDHKSHVATVSEETIAEINARTIHSAARQIYCSDLGFKFSDNGEIKSGSDFVNQMCNGSEA